MPQATYQAPTHEDLKSVFGENLTEIELATRSSDVDEYVETLEKAMQVTKEHSIQFG